MTVTEQVYETLLARLTPDTWNERGASDGRHKFCLAVHLTNVCIWHGITTHKGFRPMRQAILDLFPERIPMRTVDAVNVALFNDHPDTTFEDVMLVVKTAREQVRTEECLTGT